MRTVSRGRFASICFMGLMAFVVASFVTVPVHAQDYRALVAAPDRSAADREIAAPLTGRMTSGAIRSGC